MRENAHGISQLQSRSFSRSDAEFRHEIPLKTYYIYYNTSHTSVKLPKAREEEEPKDILVRLSL